MSSLFQLQVFDFLFNGLIQVSKTALQFAHSGYKDFKIFGTKVWGGSLDFNIYPYPYHCPYHCCHLLVATKDFCGGLIALRSEVAAASV